MDLFNMKIIQHPFACERPKLQIDPNFIWITDKFRDEMNTYLKDRFGMERIAIIMQGKIFVDPQTMVKIRNIQKEEEI